MNEKINQLVTELVNELENSKTRAPDYTEVIVELVQNLLGREDVIKQIVVWGVDLNGRHYRLKLL